MSDNDDVDLSWVMRSGKAENDFRSAHGLPADGNYDVHSRADDVRGGGGGSLIGAIVWGAFVVVGYLAWFGLWLMWEIMKGIGSAIFSGRR